MDKKHKEILNLFKDCMPLFSVLTDENRQRILILLSEYEEGLNVNSITENTKLSRPAVSHHLKNLKASGFIDARKKGTENFYFLTLKTPIEKLKSLINQIESNCNLK